MRTESTIRLLPGPVAITGVGLATSLGLTAEATWAAVRDGHCGMGAMPHMESPLPPGSDGGQAPPLPADFATELPREARYLRWAIEAALRDAGAPDAQAIDGDRCAVMLGTTLHGMRAGGRFLRTGDYAHLRDFLAGDTLRLATAGLGLAGPSATTCSACSSSLGAVALGATMLRAGHADRVIAGGYDAISEYAWAGFNALRLVSPVPLRPFTKGRQGMKLGEGYGIVVLERLPDVALRSGRARAIVSGWGESADAHHLTQPHPRGEGASRAMRAALAGAGVEATALDLIAAHATGTPDNDAAEYAALADLLGDKLRDVPVVAFKSHLGHTLGGAGTAELILSTLAIRDGLVPACANVDPAHIEFDGLRVSSGTATSRPIRRTLNTSLGFGGANTCVVLSAPDAPASPLRDFAGATSDANRSAPRTPPPHAATGATRRSGSAGGASLGIAPGTPTDLCPREVWITGIGVVLPGVAGNDAFVARLRDPAAEPAWASPPAAIDEADFLHLLNARRVRRMSTYVKLTLAAAALACGDAGIEGRAASLAETAALLGTTHGSSSHCHTYYSQLVREGVTAANPVLFAEGVPNVGAAQLSLMLGLKGACQSIIGSRTAGLDALRLAWLRIASGASDRIIVGAGEESQPDVEKAYESCGLRSADGGPSSAPFTTARGFCSTAGAVSFILESADAARAGGRTPYAVIDQAVALSGEREMLPRTLGRLLAMTPPTSHVISSANGTWLDRAEQAALSRLPAETTIGNAYAPFGEGFSVTALIGIAAALLTGEVPLAKAAGGSVKEGSRRTGLGERGGYFRALCSDWTGAAASATLHLSVRSAGGDAQAV